jgi:hypothetical protein
MKLQNALKLTGFTLVSIFITSCTFQEDPGPLQYAEQEYLISDFDRLDLGSALDITVQYGENFAIKATGDKRNLDDLILEKNGTTLTARFDERNWNRHHVTSLFITMPDLKSAGFSGASNSKVTGVVNGDSFSLTLSGASVSNVDLNSFEVDLRLSGASNLTITGSVTDADAELSGASLLKAYSMTAENVTLDASGASNAYVTATQTLKVNASGASVILYRGDAQLDSKVSGASTVRKD